MMASKAMRESLRVMEGSSSLKNESDAIAEATKSWNKMDQLGIVFIFYAPTYDAHRLAKALQDRFPKIATIGCSTAGEWLQGHFSRGGLVVMGLAGYAVRWSVAHADFSQAEFNAEKADAVVANLLKKNGSELNEDKQFVICLPDGTSGYADMMVSYMNDALHGVPMVGGSAGDYDSFEKTTVMANGRVLSSGVVFAMGETALPFCIQLHQHFKADSDDVVVTEVSKDGHIIHTLDGIPAVECYMRLFNLERDELTKDMLEQCSLVYQNNGNTVANIVGKVLDDGGLWLYNTVEEGILLNRSIRGDMQASLEKEVKAWPDAQVALVFNCCIRTVEWRRKQCGEIHNMLAPLNEKADYFIGFDTYGEQYHGMNQTQTLTVLLLGVGCVGKG